MGMKVLGWLTAIVSLICISAAWSGYVFSVLWGWFVVPVFALPTVSVAQAIGISLVVSCLIRPKADDQSEGAGVDGALMAAFAKALSFPLVGLLIGWVVQHWV